MAILIACGNYIAPPLAYLFHLLIWLVSLSALFWESRIYKISTQIMKSNKKVQLIEFYTKNNSLDRTAGSYRLWIVYHLLVGEPRKTPKCRLHVNFYIEVILRAFKSIFNERLFSKLEEFMRKSATVCYQNYAEKFLSFIPTYHW